MKNRNLMLILAVATVALTLASCAKKNGLSDYYYYAGLYGSGTSNNGCCCCNGGCSEDDNSSTDATDVYCGEEGNVFCSDDTITINTFTGANLATADATCPDGQYRAVADGSLGLSSNRLMSSDDTPKPIIYATGATVLIPSTVQKMEVLPDATVLLTVNGATSAYGKLMLVDAEVGECGLPVSALSRVSSSSDQQVLGLTSSLNASLNTGLRTGAQNGVMYGVKWCGELVCSTGQTNCTTSQTLMRLISGTTSSLIGIGTDSSCTRTYTRSQVLAQVNVTIPSGSYLALGSNMLLNADQMDALRSSGISEMQVGTTTTGATGLYATGIRRLAINSEGMLIDRDTCMAVLDNSMQQVLITLSDVSSLKVTPGAALKVNGISVATLARVAPTSGSSLVSVSSGLPGVKVPNPSISSFSAVQVAKEISVNSDTALDACVVDNRLINTIDNIDQDKLRQANEMAQTVMQLLR